MARVVVLAGGSPHAHDFAAIGTALTDLIDGLGHDVVVETSPDRAAARVAAGADALVMCALWWRMLGDAYDEWRDRYAYSPPASTREALAEFVRTGGGLVAIHTSVICFDDWPQWGDIVGADWCWGQSSHPPYGPVRARVVAAHPVVDGLTSTIDLHDEVYGDLDVRQEVVTLATARREPDDTDQPVLWTHRFGQGRVVFDGFGHDAASIRDESNARIIAQAVGWVLETGT